MKQSIKEEWINRLRSGRYAQGSKALRSDNGYCCLGVLCEAAVDAGQADRYAVGEPGNAAYSYGPIDGDPNYYPQRAPYYLPQVVVEWADMIDQSDPIVKIGELTQSVSNHNDDGRTFEEIAQAIEDQVAVTDRDSEETGS